MLLKVWCLSCTAFPERFPGDDPFLLKMIHFRIATNILLQGSQQLDLLLPYFLFTLKYTIYQFHLHVELCPFAIK